jgi:membrane-associated HD superfamily phosphohydrolase
VDAFVEKMVAGKMNEGQMEEADLSIKDLVTVKNVLKQYLVQVHHERVEYPENKTNK